MFQMFITRITVLFNICPPHHANTFTHCNARRLPSYLNCKLKDKITLELFSTQYILILCCSTFITGEVGCQNENIVRGFLKRKNTVYIKNNLSVPAR